MSKILKNILVSTIFMMIFFSGQIHPFAFWRKGNLSANIFAAIAQKKSGEPENAKKNNTSKNKPKEASQDRKKDPSASEMAMKPSPSVASPEMKPSVASPAIIPSVSNRTMPDKSQLERWEKIRRDMISYGTDYLRFIQSENGSFSSSPRAGIGVNVIVLLGLLESGLSPNDPMIVKGLENLLKNVQKDGGIYSRGGVISVYEGCLSLSCLNLARKKGVKGLDEKIAAAEKFIRSQQYSEKTGTQKDDLYYGGLGYGSGSRPDLSNTQFFMETLHELGCGPEDEAIQNALVFVSRCQNLDTEDNPTKFAEKNSDGGFFYTCVGEGENPAGEVDGGLRSYGSITYAGLKSLIYAGLTKEDPRVKAASEWIRDNYTLTENPGLGQRGLFYYYHTLSKTLNVLKNDIFIDKDNKEHYWKGELIDLLKQNQNEDGSWMNENRMWMENDPVLVTGYVLIVLAYCQ